MSNTNVYPHKTGIIVDFEGNNEDQVKDSIAKTRVDYAVEKVKEKAIKYMWLV